MESLRIRSGVAWPSERTAYFAHSTNTTEATSVFQAGTNITRQTIKELEFAAAKSIRTSTIILAAFNAVAAFATACGILYHAYSIRKRNARQYRTSSLPQTSWIEPSEIYPLILSCGITIQGITFAIAQAQGLHSLLSSGCTLVSQFVLPAIFIVPYIQVVFGIEFAVRGMRKTPFPPRAKYTVTICLVIICMLLIVNFLVADFVRSPNFCFASLFWFVAIYSRGCFAALLAIDIILVLCVVIIFVQLTRSTKIEAPERVSASRMVYYLALAILSNTLIMPYFCSLGFQQGTKNQGRWNMAITLSMVASVVANVSGLMTGGLHLFLRANTITTIGPRFKTGEFDRRRIKGSIRRFGGSEPDFAGHMMGPVGSMTDRRRMLSDASSISGAGQDVKEEEAGMMSSRSPAPDPLRSNAFRPRLNTDDAAAAASVRTPEPVQKPASVMVPEPAVASALSTVTARNIPSPPENTETPLLLPATTYNPGSVKTLMAGSSGRYDMSSLKPPPSMHDLTSGHHRRGSSIISSATVQIGLRLSNVNDFRPTDSQILDKKVYTLDMPRFGSTLSTAGMAPASGPVQAQQQPPQQKEAALLAPTIFKQQQPSSLSPPSLPPFIPLPVRPPPQQDSQLLQAAPARRPTPLSNIGHLSVSSYGSEELSVAFFEDDSSYRDSVKDAGIKSPLLVPRPLVYKAREYIPDDEDAYGDNAQLSPSLYSSQSSPTASAATMATKLPTPRGVGFATVSRSNSPAAFRTIAASASGPARSPSAVAVSPANVTSAPRRSGGNDISDKTSSDWI